MPLRKYLDFSTSGAFGIYSTRVPSQLRFSISVHHSQRYVPNPFYKLAIHFSTPELLQEFNPCADSGQGQLWRNLMIEYLGPVILSLRNICINIDFEVIMRRQSVVLSSILDILSNRKIHPGSEVSDPRNKRAEFVAGIHEFAD